ncbi:MAG: phosphotransferase, partial [Caldilineaceae bacterium]|nr:phosphotransferase [Caldilineaceae bacterium]
MINNLYDRIDGIESDTLLPLVQQALRTDIIEIPDWTTEQLHGGTFGVVTRFQGEANGSGINQPWSLILKVVHNASDAPLDRSTPSNSRYWQREPLVYQSDLLATLPDGFAVPHCDAVQVQAQEEIWLWQEDVTETPVIKWSTDRFALAARHFGRFNGSFLTRRPLPTCEWLGRDLLRVVAKEAETGVLRLPTLQTHPLVGRIFPPDIVAANQRLWHEREHFFAAVEQLPHTICHRDANRRNMRSRTADDGKIETVVIDWEDVAIAPVGEELAALIILAPALREIPLHDVDPFEQLVFDQYMAG